MIRLTIQRKVFLATFALATAMALLLTLLMRWNLGEATVRQTWEPHFPQCEIHVMANAGHYPMFETPVQLATVIERFLAD